MSRILSKVSNIRMFASSVPRCAGHSHWSSIKHDKARNDAKRNRTASQHANRLEMATRIGGGPDPTLNFKLATAIEIASKANVPRKVIENAIKRGSGESSTSGGPSDIVVYEAMGPRGVAFLVEALTDNKNRTASNVKFAFTKHSGALSPTSYLFVRQGWILVHSDLAFDKVFDKVAGVDDSVQDIVEGVPRCQEEEISPGDRAGLWTVYTPHEDTGRIARAMRQDAELKVKDCGIEFNPDPDTAVEAAALPEEGLADVRKVLAALDEIDDVTAVYTNLV